MIFLDEPSLGETAEAWKAWLTELQQMNQRDFSVKSAITMAERVLAQMAAMPEQERANLAQ